VSQIDEITFLRKLQRLLEEGDFVATYKFALLQALADLSVEKPTEKNGTLKVSRHELAEKFIEYYWPQARPYRKGLALKQNTGGQASIVNRVAEEHPRYKVSLAAARQDQRGWRRLVGSVANTVKKMPLWKLQTVAGQPDEFLYRRDRFVGQSVILEPGVAACFRTFHPFIVNMVRGAWIDHLLRIQQNQALVGPKGDLSEFLFGSERRPLDRYRAILREHQSGRCFYCDRRVRAREEALDHFIPWSRYPVDLGHNFVFADARCNRQKRDYLAHPRHLAKWGERNIQQAEQLGAMFDDALLRHDAERSRKVAWWAYEQAGLAEARVWISSNEFETLDSLWKDMLETQQGQAGETHV
jgi:5-methylcytosine-specific restriction endonuclease McrA